MAIMLPEKDEDAINVVAVSVIITLVISIISLILIFPFRNSLAILLKSPEIAHYLLFIPVTVFAIGLYTIFNLWLNRKAHFKSISAGKITRSAFSSFFSIGFGLTLFKTGGLILADTIGQLVSGIYVMIRFLKYDRHKIRFISKESMIKQSGRYKHFPKFNILSGLLEKSSGQLPVIMLTTFFGAATVGFISFAQRIIGIPGSLIGASAGDVFRQQAILEFQKNGNCRDTFLDLLKLLIRVAIIPFLIIFFFSPFLFAFIFGPEWRIAGEYARIMTFMFFLSFIVGPLSNMFIIAEKQKIDLIVQVFLFSFLLLSILAGYNFFHDPKAVIVLYSITYCIKYFIELYLSYQFSKGFKNS